MCTFLNSVTTCTFLQNWHFGTSYSKNKPKFGRGPCGAAAQAFRDIQPFACPQHRKLIRAPKLLSYPIAQHSGNAQSSTAVLLEDWRAAKGSLTQIHASVKERRGERHERNRSAQLQTTWRENVQLSSAWRAAEWQRHLAVRCDCIIHMRCRNWGADSSLGGKSLQVTFSEPLCHRILKPSPVKWFLHEMIKWIIAMDHHYWL